MKKTNKNNVITLEEIKKFLIKENVIDKNYNKNPFLDKKAATDLAFTYLEIIKINEQRKINKLNKRNKIVFI